MADGNVLAAQKYLNSMFGHSSHWVKLTENGNTGTTMMTAIVRAFQLQNGVSNPNGNLGPATLAKMKSLSPIKKMNVDDPTSINVCLIQCALFCKGYNAGGITGIYYTTGVNGVKTYQENAGLDATGVIDWKVWQGLLSYYWFTEAWGGDSTIRKIQKQINNDISDYIGVGPCDGVKSRITAQSIIAALQIAEGLEVVDDLNYINFGPNTISLCPTLKSGNNKTAFNKVVQYGLYFNGITAVTTFDGIYDSYLAARVGNFQTLYGLDGMTTSGVCCPRTMQSLLTSRGDVTRPSKACDCSTVLNEKQAADLKVAGYTHVGRYLTGSVGNDFVPKFITFDEIKNIEAAGLKVFPIYQDGGYYLDYFKAGVGYGYRDAHIANNAAKKIGVPKGTTIYFAVDFDCFDTQIDNYIKPYFDEIISYFKTSSEGYKVGVYAPREVCNELKNTYLSSLNCFVADMSVGFTGNLGHKIPTGWAFDQFYEYTFPSTPSFHLDKVAYSGVDKGISKFDDVSSIEVDPQDAYLQELKIRSLRLEYARKVVDGFGANFDSSITVNGPSVEISRYEDTSTKVVVKASCSSTLSTETDAIVTVNISADKDGKLSTTTKDQITGLAATVSKETGEDIYGTVLQEKLESVAINVKSGKLKLRLVDPTESMMKIEAIVDTEAECKEIQHSINVSIKITIEITVKPGYKLDPEMALAAVTVVALVGLVGWIASLGAGTVSVIYTLLTGLGMLLGI